MLVGFVLNGLFLWIIKCLQLEKWKSKYQTLFPSGSICGQVDAYISLGNYAYKILTFFPIKSDISLYFSEETWASTY